MTGLSRLARQETGGKPRRSGAKKVVGRVRAAASEKWLIGLGPVVGTGRVDFMRSRCLAEPQAAAGEPGVESCGLLWPSSPKS